VFSEPEKYKQQRQQLVDSIRKKGISDEKVLSAIGSVPRQFFMDPSHKENAYMDKAFPISEGQTISQPYTVAYQTQLLDVKPGYKVLEIGTGSGYQAAVLAAMGAKVYTIERQKKLFEKNRGFIFLNSYANIEFFFGDGYEGLPDYAPFDRILITAAAPEVPPDLLRQLKPAGLMVLPLGKAPVQRMVRITKMDDEVYAEDYFDDFSFVPMLSGKHE
jgi:protein-L-isoaspartate(D-aspartate) O-methyltransferase